MDALRDDATAAGQPSTLAGTHWQQAQIAFQRGDLARCESEARAAVEIGGDVLRPLADPWRVLALVEQGQLDEAEALSPGHDRAERACCTRRSASAGGCGSPAATWRVRSRISPRRATATAAYYPLRVEPPWQPLLVEALVLAGRDAEAAAEVDAFARRRRALGHARAPTASSPACAPCSRPASRRSRCSSRPCEHFATAPLERARALVELGARQGAAGERGRSPGRRCARAFDAAHACGATALAQRARDELRLVGGRPRTPAGGELTPAERRVADLAAGGATNREIARLLFLSPKTIEMHLRSVYRKLGIKGRPGSGTG